MPTPHRESKATGSEKAELGGLGAAIVAVREEVAYAAATSAAEKEGGGNGSSNMLQPSGLTQAQEQQLAARRAALALSPAATQLAARQVREKRHFHRSVVMEDSCSIVLCDGARAVTGSHRARCTPGDNSLGLTVVKAQQVVQQLCHGQRSRCHLQSPILLHAM